jgi:hypothetical protein
VNEVFTCQTSEARLTPSKIHTWRFSVLIPGIATRLRRGRTTALIHAFAVAAAFTHLLLLVSLIYMGSRLFQFLGARTQIQIDVMIDGNWIDYV